MGQVMNAEDRLTSDEGPSREDLLAVASFAEVFDRPGFCAGEWTPLKHRDDGRIELGWWNSAQAVSDWEWALYHRRIVTLDSDYLADSNVTLVNNAIADPSMLACVRLPRLRCALTFLVRAERHTGGGWYARAFESGMAQAATRRLGEIAKHR